MALLLSLSALGGAAAGTAQERSVWPERGENLQVLPADFSDERIRAVMLGFSRALGVRCSHCHVGEEGAPLATFDFVSDANPNKDRARAMYRMLGDINRHLRGIEPSGPSRVNMWCHTCHAGRPRPQTLDEAVMEAHASGGAAAAVEVFLTLREHFYGAAGYDFTPEGVDAVVRGLLDAPDTAGALGVLAVAAAGPDAGRLTWERLGDVRAATGDVAGAREAYTRALALAPAADGLRAKRAALPDAAPPSGSGSGWRTDADVRGPGGRLLEVSVLATDVRVPASLSFLPDGRALVADRAAPALYLLDPASGLLTAVEGLPPIGAFGDAGLHEIVLDPGFDENRRVYLSYTAPGEDDTYALVVARATLEDGRLAGLEPIFTALPFLERALGHHYGGRMVVDGDHLYVTSGDRDHRELPQALDNHVGKVLRIHTDGRVPADNPFVDRPGARPEIWTYGHRNPQGLERHPRTGELWSTEHGPRGGDEVNVLRAGANYGWPRATFGHEYEGGAVGEGRTFMEGAEAPRHVWTPSIGPSDLVFHSGRGAPEWEGSALVGAMALRHLNRLELDGDAMRVEERLLGGRGHRIRAVAEGPDGALFLAADGGVILRLRPAP